MNFGDKPAPDIATNAINTLAKLSQAEFPEAAKEVQEHVYEDDIGGSRETTAKAKHFQRYWPYPQVRSLPDQGSAFQSN